MFGFNFGGSSSKQRTASWISPEDKARQEANYTGIQGTPGYQATSADQINGYLNPYIQNVVDKTGEAFGHGLQILNNQIGDAASRAHAFGGSRHGVAQGVADAQALNDYGLLSSQLYSHGYDTALGAAQNENQFGYQGLLSRLGLQNQALGLVTPDQYTKGRGTAFGGGINASFGGGKT